MKRFGLSLLVVAMMTGCASVKMEPKEASDKAKQFATPSNGKAGVYVYRDSFVGQALTKDIWLDGKCVGQSAKDVFFHTETEPGSHTLSTQSEFSPNDLTILLEAGKNYFYRQFIKMGVFVGGADLEAIPEAQAKPAIAKLGLATPGTCGSTYKR